MRVYIAGPMTGLPGSNYPAFHAAAAALRDVGWEVENPAEHFGGDETRSYKDYVAADLASLRACDAIALLPGWDRHTAHGSGSGAVWEYHIASELLGLRVYDAEKPEPPRSEPPGRCAKCGWPLQETEAEGCVPDNCSFRAEQHFHEIRVPTPHVSQVAAAREAVKALNLHGVVASQFDLFLPFAPRCPQIDGLRDNGYSVGER